MWCSAHVKSEMTAITRSTLALRLGRGDTVAELRFSPSVAAHAGVSGPMFELWRTDQRECRLHGGPRRGVTGCIYRGECVSLNAKVPLVGLLSMSYVLSQLLGRLRLDRHTHADARSSSGVRGVRRVLHLDQGLEGLDYGAANPKNGGGRPIGCSSPLVVESMLRSLQPSIV